jgi:hypothetical protein
VEVLLVVHHLQAVAVVVVEVIPTPLVALMFVVIEPVCFHFQ